MTMCKRCATSWIMSFGFLALTAWLFVHDNVSGAYVAVLLALMSALSPLWLQFHRNTGQENG